ncbi:SDR family NAD(P)-dependent oxidoreductase [Micromonospora thermarum]|uniref:SDR family oxidoreductase n=1 Tax=Micromonospora thermarum TaxID=2720024 RepID=A0ABX0Z2H3_9ACTN|nr:SDR family oxidoreductase [Micromonospora thermarum]NJP31997.1 SDR family oxidoreductase [Micromonospora thermarum]
MNDVALITGASTGIGAEFARQLAERGHDLVLVARSVDRMEALAATLRQTRGVRVEVIGQDLAAPDAAERVVTELRTRGLEVSLLVNNAGFGTCGRFEEVTGPRDHDQLMVNVVALTDLTHALVPPMLARGTGAVLNVASTAAFQPAAYFAVYSAAKAFVLNFSLALWSEYRDRGVRVLALCPGPVETEFFATIGTDKAAIGGRKETPQRVVAKALRALDRNEGYVVAGPRTFALAHLQPRRPRKLVARISRIVTRGVLTA